MRAGPPAIGLSCQTVGILGATGDTMPKHATARFARSTGRGGFTMVELIVALAILTLCMTAGMKAFQLYRGKMAENLPQRLMLQMEARRALVNLYRILQDGIEVVSPEPGSTLPYLVFKDSQNNVCVVYLEEAAKSSDAEKIQLYRAMLVVREPSGGLVGAPKVLMEHVVKLNFTAYSRGAVYLSTQLRGGSKDFSLVNFVRLQNATTEATQ